MDLFQFFIGLSIFLLGILIMILQHRDNFKKGLKRSNTSVGLTVIAVLGIIIGLFFIFNSM